MLKKSSSFQEKYQGYEILKYGSSINGLCSKLSSDLDLTIFTKISNSEMVLRDILGVINKYGANRYQINTQPRKDRAGWILKFRDTKLEIDIDLMVNKYSEVLNSNLILEYS